MAKSLVYDDIKNCNGDTSGPQSSSGVDKDQIGWRVIQRDSGTLMGQPVSLSVAGGIFSRFTQMWSSLSLLVFTVFAIYLFIFCKDTQNMTNFSLVLSIC